MAKHDTFISVRQCYLFMINFFLKVSFSLIKETGDTVLSVVEIITIYKFKRKL